MSITVYIVEEPSIAGICEAILESELPGAFRIELFHSSARALASFRQARVKPEVVCASLLKMSGLELAYQIKSIEPNTRFLLMSGYPISEANAAILNADTRPDAFLPKPFTKEAFAGIIRALVWGIALPLGDSSSGAWPFCDPRFLKRVSL